MYAFTWISRVVTEGALEITHASRRGLKHLMERSLDQALSWQCCILPLIVAFFESHRWSRYSFEDFQGCIV